MFHDQPLNVVREFTHRYPQGSPPLQSGYCPDPRHSPLVREPTVLEILWPWIAQMRPSGHLTADRLTRNLSLAQVSV